MSEEEEQMNVLSWIPQVKPNNISVESTNRIKPILLTPLKLRYISRKEDSFKRMVLYFRVLEPNSLNIVIQDMIAKIITETYLHFGIIL